MNTMIKLIAESLVLATPNLSDKERLAVLAKELPEAKADRARNSIIDAVKGMDSTIKDAAKTIQGIIKNNPLADIVRTPNMSTVKVPDTNLNVKAPLPSASYPDLPIAKQPTPIPSGIVFVNIRKHPNPASKQPRGVRKVHSMKKIGDKVAVLLGDGSQGWELDPNQPAPLWLDFIVGGPKGNTVSFKEAMVQFGLK